MKIRIRNTDDLDTLLKKVRRCRVCESLPLGPNPILQAGTQARILIVGQAPGRLAHERGLPFDDPSGNRLRDWLGVEPQSFYDPTDFALLPMGFCFPGSGTGGDLPPRLECAETWRVALLDRLPDIRLTLVIGQYAHDWHLGDSRGRTLAETVRNWQAFWPDVLPMPHPSPRNNRWLKQNSFFEADVVPVLRARVQELLDRTSHESGNGE